jgi:hypothetical protein
MRGLRVGLLAVIVAAWGLAGCGLSIPDIKEAWDSDYPGNPETGAKPISGTTLIEFEIKKKIYCELKKAVAAANAIPTTESNSLGGKQTLKYPGLFPPGWVAQVALSLQIDESVSLNPGLSYTQTMANAAKAFGVGNTVTIPQSFSLGLGATLSSTATRIDKFNPQYSIAFLSEPDTKDAVCVPGNDPLASIAPSDSAFQIESDLGIEKWLVGALLVDSYLPSDPTQSNPSSPRKPNTAAAAAGGSGRGGSGGEGGGGGGGSTKGPMPLSYEIKFVIVSTGSVTPTWKLVQMSANTASSFFGAGRTRTHDLIITIGPNSTATDNSHLASQISAGVATANRALISGN